MEIRMSSLMSSSVIAGNKEILNTDNSNYTNRSTSKRTERQSES